MDLRDFELERTFARHEFSTPLQLSASDAEPATVGTLVGDDPRALAELLALRLGYTETRGAPELRAAIAERTPGVGPEDVLVVQAPQEGIFLSMLALLHPGDAVVVQTPCYASLAEVPRALGCAVRPWPLRRDAGGAWSADLVELEGLLRGATLLVTNTPHNPTGFHFDHEAWQRLAVLAAASGVRWFSDEMYRGLEPEPGLALPPAAALDARAVSLSGLSKSHGLAGLRLGWLASRDAELLARVEARKDYTSICTSAPAQHLGRLALLQGDRLVQTHRARIAANAELVSALAERHPRRLAWTPPTAGPVALVRVLHEPAEAHAERLRTRHGVLAIPASLFDLDESSLRVGLGRAGLPAALEAWEACLRSDGAPSTG